MQDIYTDTIKVQNLECCNDLRLKAQLFPPETRLFKIALGITTDNRGKIGKGALSENLSFDAVES